MIYAALDYSMTSPAMCVYDTIADDYWFYYMTNKKSGVHIAKHLDSRLIESRVSVTTDIRDEKVNSSIARFDAIAEYFMETVDHYQIRNVFLEGYSLGSKGKVFSIAENTAILKYHLLQRYADVRIYPPTVVKKFATGKGNSNKRAMKDAYETQVTLPYLQPVSHYTESPYTDLIDAYWIMQYGLSHVHDSDMS